MKNEVIIDNSGNECRCEMISDTLQDIIAALAELQNRARIPVYVLGDLRAVNEQLWSIVDLCDDEESP